MVFLSVYSNWLKKENLRMTHSYEKESYLSNGIIIIELWGTTMK